MIRAISMLMLFLSGIGFGLYGAKDPINFPQVASVVLLLGGIALQAWDYVENTQ
jgi:hypothetical protein